MNNVVKNFDILATSLSVPHNYFNDLIKLFSDLYLAKFLDTSAVLAVQLRYNQKGFERRKVKEKG